MERYTCQSCQQGEHEYCTGKNPPPPGMLGGDKCDCDGKCAERVAKEGPQETALSTQVDEALEAVNKSAEKLTPNQRRWPEGDGWPAPDEAIRAAWRVFERDEGGPMPHRNTIAAAVSAAFVAQPDPEEGQEPEGTVIIFDGGRSYESALAAISHLILASNPGQTIVVQRAHIDQDDRWFTVTVKPYATQVQADNPSPVEREEES